MSTDIEKIELPNAEGTVTIDRTIGHKNAFENKTDEFEIELIVRVEKESSHVFLAVLKNIINSWGITEEQFQGGKENLMDKVRVSLKNAQHNGYDMKGLTPYAIAMDLVTHDADLENESVANVEIAVCSIILDN